MPFFRTTLDIRKAQIRPATANDLTAVSRLMHHGSYRFVGYPPTDLAALLGTAPASVIEHGDTLWGVAVLGWPLNSVAWMRGAALVSGLNVKDGIGALLPDLHWQARAAGVRHLYYAGEISADAWLIPALEAHDYRHHTDVVVYEKHSNAIPSHGNQQIRVRAALPVDLPALLELDQICFEPQWNKDDHIIGTALATAPLFLVAKHNGEAIGYAFATMHFQGRLVHLVRIAVHPRGRGLGIGVRLLAEVVTYARRMGADTLALNTQADNYHAQRLYEWFGFRRTGERQPVLQFAL